MKIDWKELAKSPGYRSLKQAYIRDLQQYRQRDKQERLKLFHWIICRAKHYSDHTGQSVAEILNTWESKRNYWWVNYYGPHRQPKFNEGAQRPMGIKGYRKYLQKDVFGKNDPAYRKRRMKKFIQTEQARNKKKPHRWPESRKKRMRELRAYRDA